MTPSIKRQPNPNDLKRGKRLATLWALAILTVLLAVATQLHANFGRGQAWLAGPVLAKLQSDLPKIASITITNPGSRFSLVRDGENWVMPERDNFPIDPQILAQLAKELGDLRQKQLRTSDPAQFAVLGVDDPASPSPEAPQMRALIVMRQSSGEILHALHIGGRDQSIFVRKAGKNDVYESEGVLMALDNPAAFLMLDILDVTPEMIASVSGARTGAASFDIVRRPDGGFAPVGGVANVTATTAALALSKLSFKDVIAAPRLTTQPVASHVTNLRDGRIVTANAYAQTGRYFIRLSAAATDTTQSQAAAALNKQVAEWAFEIDATTFADFTFPTQAIVKGPTATPLDQAKPLP